MAKAAENFVCQNCGTFYRKWQGKCDGCNEWNTIVQEIGADPIPRGLTIGKGNVIELTGLTGETEQAPRMATGIAEFDRACGGGLVPGSALLVGGDPGIGKSTILLQAAALLARRNVACVYISGEEAAAQIRSRAARLGLSDSPLELGSETSLRNVMATLEQRRPQMVVIDSIQTLFADNVESAPGSVSQVRACAQELIRFAKRRQCTVVLVGHVTKDGQIAGPRVLEHMVDTVLYFEGERGHQFRILRAVKNRYGGTDEIGVFEMTDKGLAEVPNPSALFLTNRREPVSGAAVFAGIEGTRPVLVEIQALVAPSPLATPRRAVVGWDTGRLAMVMAVLDARCGLGFGGQDVYLNVAGGLRVSEPAADLAVAAALISSLTDVPVPAETVIFGEISLAGEVRPVAQTDARLKEAEKLGFFHAWLPNSSKTAKTSLRLTELEKLQAVNDLFVV
ncbi:DNA repair protein RadA [Emcibacter sp. SYSU 3D8]|uniref:DNA repair protein RadA n=1 Tax=Emcibacter sp. SYSU 3D8 TaxID=3133969 RepID=UPI0031FE8F0E